MTIINDCYQIAVRTCGSVLTSFALESSGFNEIFSAESFKKTFCRNAKGFVENYAFCWIKKDGTPFSADHLTPLQVGARVAIVGGVTLTLFRAQKVFGQYFPRLATVANLAVVYAPMPLILGSLFYLEESIPFLAEACQCSAAFALTELFLQTVARPIIG